MPGSLAWQEVGDDTNKWLPGGIAFRRLSEWEDQSVEENITYILICIALVCFAGCMSGLTLGLLSMDVVELEILKRSGTAGEKRCAERIVPIIKNAHYLLVTLLLCNAAAMEALPIVLDKVVHEVVAIIISVTAVLFFGEIIPQAACSKYGLQIGAAMAMPVRMLMILTFPISWPLSKMLDFVLGGEASSLFRRKQLKALVHIHAKDEGFGGKLTADEIQIITGALDLTTKTAYHAMTPIEKVFMLSTNQLLDEATVEAIMSSKPYSRLPIYRGDNKKDILGLILVKELLEYVQKFPNSPVSSLKIRPLPRLSACTPMYDMLKLFRTGRAHMALLTQPLLVETTTPAGSTLTTSVENLSPHALEATPLMEQLQGQQQGLAVKGPKLTVRLPTVSKARPCCASTGAEAPSQAQGKGDGEFNASSDERPLVHSAQASMEIQRAAAGIATAVPAAAAGHRHHSQHGHHRRGGTGGGGAARSFNGGGGDETGTDHYDTAASTVFLLQNTAVLEGTPDIMARTPDFQRDSSSAVADFSLQQQSSIQLGTPEVLHTSIDMQGGVGGSVNSKMSRSRSAITSIRRFFNRRGSTGFGSEEEGGQVDRSGSTTSPSDSDSDDDVDDMVPIPLIAMPGEPIGIITIEDVIEELMQFEIIDETDKFVDNEQSVLVADMRLDETLPEAMKMVLSLADAAKGASLTKVSRNLGGGLKSVEFIVPDSKEYKGRPEDKRDVLAHQSKLTSIMESMLRPCQSALALPGAAAGGPGAGGGSSEAIASAPGVVGGGGAMAGMAELLRKTAGLGRSREALHASSDRESAPLLGMGSVNSYGSSPALLAVPKSDAHSSASQPITIPKLSSLFAPATAVGGPSSGGKSLEATSGGNSALASALLIAAGKRAPLQPAAAGGGLFPGSHPPKLVQANFTVPVPAKPSEELFSYLESAKQQQQLQAGARTAPELPAPKERKDGKGT